MKEIYHQIHLGTYKNIVESVKILILNIIDFIITNLVPI